MLAVPERRSTRTSRTADQAVVAVDQTLPVSVVSVGWVVVMAAEAVVAVLERLVPQAVPVLPES